MLKLCGQDKSQPASVSDHFRACAMNRLFNDVNIVGEEVLYDPTSMSSLSFTEAGQTIGVIDIESTGTHIGAASLPRYYFSRRSSFSFTLSYTLKGTVIHYDRIVLYYRKS